MAKTITSVVSKPNGFSSKTTSSLELHLKKTPIRTLKSPSEELTEKIDSGAPPPFNLDDIRAVIPKHCWVKNPWMSMSYLARDVAIVFGLAAVATYFNNWLLWPLYWFAQGTMFWALFNLGHDCGHGSFSDNPKLNSVVGHFLHSSLLVPYHGWRIKHRNHHQDNSDGDFFLPNEKKDVLISRVCWAAMAALLVSLNFVMGPIQMIKLYVIPYAIMLTWLDLVTNLHHHSHEDKLPWHSGKEWSSLKDGLTTSDGDYGFINKINHNIGAHVMHHLFPEIPHYHLAEATEAAKPVLGKYCTEPKKSGPVPYHLLESLIKMYCKRNEMAQDSGGKKCKGLGFCKSFTHGIT